MALDETLARRSTPRTVIMDLVIAGFTLLVIMVGNSSADHRNSTRLSTHDETENNWKSEGSVCPHKDYRSYVKCLQSHRRSREHGPHATSRGSPPGGVNCMEECERDSCRHQNSGPCAEVCYDRCLKKTKEIHHRITEYESSCDEGEDCDKTGKSGPGRGLAGIANLTTSIDIRNYLNNTNVIMTNPQTNDAGNRIDRGPGDRKDHEDRDNRNRNNTCKGQAGCDEVKTDDGRRGLGPPRGSLPGFQPWYPGPSLTLVPQIQMVPQVTFGLGFTSPGVGLGAIGGGCPYTSIWLCLPQQQQQQVQQVRDCSGCEHPYPYQRGRCDPSC